MQARGRGSAPPPIGIAFDGDLGNRIDAVLAVAMLNGLAAKGEARTHRAHHLEHEPEDGAAGRRDRRVLRRAPARSAASRDDRHAGRRAAGRRHAGSGRHALEDERRRDPRCTRATSAHCSTRPTTAVLMRNMLLAQNDGNATHRRSRVRPPASRGCSSLYGARPQIAAKVKQLVDRRRGLSGGTGRSGHQGDLAAARKLFAEWPTPLVAVGAEVGAALPYPGASIDEDFAWSPAHPVADAYRVVQADALRRAGLGAGGRAVRGPLRTRLFQAVRPRHDRRARRRPDAVHGVGRRQAPVPDRRSGADGSHYEGLYGHGVGAAGPAWAAVAGARRTPSQPLGRSEQGSPCV